MPMDESDRALIRLETEHDALKKEVAELKREGVTRKEFDPVRTLVFGAVGTMLLAMLSAIVALVINR